MKGEISQRVTRSPPPTLLPPLPCRNPNIKCWPKPEQRPILKNVKGSTRSRLEPSSISPGSNLRGVSALAFRALFRAAFRRFRRAGGSLFPARRRRVRGPLPPRGKKRTCRARLARGNMGDASLPCSRPRIYRGPATDGKVKKDGEPPRGDTLSSRR